MHHRMNGLHLQRSKTTWQMQDTVPPEPISPRAPPIVTKYTVHVIVTLTWMSRRPRISSLSATSSQALETSPETIFARYLHADTTTTTGFSRLSRSSMLASSTVACQKNFVTRLSAPEASIMLSIIPLPRRPSLGNKRFFTSGINPPRKSRDR